VDRLKALVRTLRRSRFPKMILQPYPELRSAKIAVTAWQWLLELDDVDEAQIVRFVKAQYQGPAPEPNGRDFCVGHGPAWSERAVHVWIPEPEEIREGGNVMVRRTLLASALGLALALATAAPSVAHGPQPLPEAACNQGTENAHENVAAPNNAGAHEAIAHDHGQGCVHRNPTVGH
jgi:hypothetical protein